MDQWMQQLTGYSVEVANKNIWDSTYVVYKCLHDILQEQYGKEDKFLYLIFIFPLYIG